MFGRLREFFRGRKDKSILRQRSQYAAAQASRLTGGWMPAVHDVNALIASSSPIIRARTMQLVRDFPPFTRAVNNLVDFVVGKGMVFQSRAAGPDGTPDKELRRRIEDRFRLWMDQADVAGELHFSELQQLAARQDGESGEYIAVETSPKRPGRHPFALQFYEAQRLTDYGATPSGTNKIEQGIEYDAETGERIAYYFADDGYGKTRRVEASRVIHNFQTLRPGQLRGVSPFAPAILLARDLGEYLQAEVDAAKLASKWLAMVETPNPAQFQDLRGQTDPLTGNKVENLENAIIEYLQPGEKITLASHNRPGEPFEAFNRFILRMVSITVNIPYELLSGDYAGMNYTTLRGVRNDFRQMLARPQFRHEQHFCRRAFRRFLDFEALAGNLPRQYFLDPSPFLRSEWIPTGMPELDPLREAKADVEFIKAGLKSPQEVILRRGRDPEEVLDQVKEWKDMCAERGLSFDAAVSTALANNPAAVDPDTADDLDRARDRAGRIN